MIGMPKKFNTPEERRAYWKQWYERNKHRSDYIAKDRATKKRIRIERREWFLNLKKTFKCENCSLNDHRVLDFHHLDPLTKFKEVSVLGSSGFAKETILAEIEKCRVLCANCHRIEHYEEKE